MSLLVRGALRRTSTPRGALAARATSAACFLHTSPDQSQHVYKVKRWRFEPRQLHLSRSRASQDHALALGVKAEVEKDHDMLRDLLDKPRLHATQVTAGLPTGLFKVEALQEPQAFVTLAEKTLVRAQLLVQRIARAGEPNAPREELARVVHNLDRLSDLLCGVIDMCELVRHAHPEKEWSEASNYAYEYLCNFMNILNTHTGLYLSLKRAMDDAMIWDSMTEEARAVATVFLRDFEKSGIHLPPQERERFVQLSDEIIVLGRSFLQEISTGNMDEVTDFPTNLLHGMDPHAMASLRVQTGFTRNPDTFPVVPGSWELHCISKFAPDERARRLAYHISFTGRHGPVDILERLLRARHELAVLTGKNSYAEMTLTDKMAATPDNVSSFLDITVEAQKPAAQAVLEALRALKGKGMRLQAWDRDFYSEKYLEAYRPDHLKPLSPYFSLGCVFTGLSRLFYLLYGIHFRAAPVQPGEVWSPDVLKLEVVDETEGGVIGTIYCDLYARVGKPPSAAHYTVRCSRRVDQDDPENDMKYGSSDELPRDVDLSNLLDVEGIPSRDRPGKFQLPIVVLMTDFQWPSASHGGVSLLRWQEVETLFHEMGHAIHSMIGRTEFHNVSGTRCATDFVELPSILMEHFLTDPAVVGLTAHHHRTGAPLAYKQLSAHLQNQRKLDALDAQQQILLAQLDQVYHSERAGSPHFSTTSEMEHVQSKIGPFDYVPDSTWQGQFGHLFGYGATYYSYLFDRAIAARVWNKVFAQAPLSREAGETFKKEVLQHGGGKNPWSMLSTVLRDDQITAGDRQAMQTIGYVPLLTQPLGTRPLQSVTPQNPNHFHRVPRGYPPVVARVPGSTPPTMIIVHHLNNSRSQRILWILEELEIPYEIKHYKRGSDQLAPKELKEAHPLGKSPVITDTERNQVVAESGAIIDYLIKYYGKGRGVAKPNEQDADNFWKQFTEASFMPTIVMKFVFMIIPTQAPFFVRPIVNVITGQVQKRFLDPDITTKIQFTANELEKRSNDGRTWIAGGDQDNGPTAADYQLLFPLEALTSGRIDESLVPQSMKNWVQWVHDRPAYRRAYEKGGPYDYAKL